MPILSARPRILIPHDFDYRKYYPGPEPLPPEATGEGLRGEILRRDGSMDVVHASSAENTMAALPEAEILFAYGVRRESLDRARSLRWIQAGSAGIDHFFKLSDVDADELRRRGIKLTSAAGVSRRVIGEHVLGCILMFARGMVRALDQQRAKYWEIFCTDELYGKTVGIIGLGEIGERVAELCKTFGTRVIAVKARPEHHKGHADSVFGLGEMDRVMQESDFLVLACPITAATRGVINRRSLALMRPTAYLVNIGRGELIVETDLIEALREGRIAGAALDTFGSPATSKSGMDGLEALSPDSLLWNMPNVIITPNHAAGSRRIYGHMADLFLRNLRLIAAGEQPPGCVV